ncbi:MAG: ATP-binding protein, partial [Clostridia bacterium]|nr:ATP-binding protein [Clostridia bacterium]
LGTVFGSTPRLPMWFKHFDQGPHGAGEAYHLGIFGKTGSGKSVLAKMILLAYARHRDMALLVIDPQGEFAKDARGSPGGGFPLRLDLVLRRLEREPVVVGVRQLVLDRWDLFEEILYESDFFEQLTIPRGENRRLACGTLRDRLDRSGVKLADLHGRRSFEQAWALLGDERIQRVFYRSEGSRERYEEADPNEFYGLRWLPLARLFQWEPGKQRVEALLQDMFTRSPRPLVVVDLSAQQQGDLLWNDTIQALVIKRLLEGIRFASERAYQGNRSLNTLVVIDEAHRLAPRERLEDEHRQRIRDTLVDAVRTTRKYGLGWMFISQTLASLHMEIIQQLRIMCFGFGLGLGSEFA